MKVTTVKPIKTINRLIIDVSSVVRACHMVGTDEEYGEKVEFEGSTCQVNGFQYAVDNFIERWIEAMNVSGTKPFSTILVLDGYSSRAKRQLIYPLYKAQRKARAPQINEQYNKAVDAIKDIVLSLGGTVMVQDGAEADDVCAYLSKKLHGLKTLFTGDQDFFALRKEDVQVWYRGDMDAHVADCPLDELLPVYKALVGDKSDNIKGAKGFGAKGFMDMISAFGPDGIDLMKELIEQGRLDELAEDVPTLKALQKIIDDKDAVYACYAVGQFFDQDINTLYSPLQITSGYVQQYDPEKHIKELEEFYGSVYLVTRTELPDFMDNIKDSLYESPFVALDIEASTPPESDAWCKLINESGDSKKQKDMFDSFGFEITGLSMTFGDNLQNTIYLPVDHMDTDNNLSDSVLEVVNLIPKDIRTFVHNSSYELTVLERTWGDQERENGFRGFLPNVWCTVLMHQYVNENLGSGLKVLSKHYFDYDQATFADVTQGKKMNELTGQHVKDYACDDTIMTAALANRCQIVLELEGTLQLWEDVEFYTQYAVAEAFNRGVPVNVERLEELEKEDQATFDKAWDFVSDYLKAKKWPGTFFDCPESFPQAVRYCFELETGNKLVTRVAKSDKLAEVCKEQGAPDIFCELVTDKDAPGLIRYVKKKFSGIPDFKISSPKQMKEVLYSEEHLNLKVRLRNPATDVMRAKGIMEGNPKTDADAVKHALAFDVKEGSYDKELLEAFQVMTTMDTRRKLFYGPYKLHVHWKDGRLHANLGQSRTTTKRFAPNNPNINQLPKKGDGVKFREIILAEKGEDLLSPDYNGQELRLQAEYSQDANFLSCYIGDHLKDVHSLTGSQIAKFDNSDLQNYGVFEQALKGKDPLAKIYRDSGKTTNFATAYGCMAPKLSVQLIIPLSEAEKFIKAKAAAFPGLDIWKEKVIEDELKVYGYTTTMMGARRHLRDGVMDQDIWVQRAAERQGVNAKIQGSGAEQTKSTMSKYWLSESLWETGTRMYWPCHDELVFSSPVADKAKELLQPMMEAQYCDMQVPIIAEFTKGPNWGQQKKY